MAGPPGARRATDPRFRKRVELREVTMEDPKEVPRIIGRKISVLSPWVTVLEKEVCFREGDPPSVYHSLTQAPYVAVIVKQYRPAVETYTWEFPAGTVDDGETPAGAAVRELREETGLHADELHEIGSYYPDTGRLSMCSTGFFARCADEAHEHSPETGIEVRRVTLPTLFQMARAGDFRHQLHLALIASALFHGRLAV
jgi:ADP-ribose pyrophosphatase